MVACLPWIMLVIGWRSSWARMGEVRCLYGSRTLSSDRYPLRRLARRHPVEFLDADPIPCIPVDPTPLRVNVELRVTQGDGSRFINVNIRRPSDTVPVVFETNSGSLRDHAVNITSGFPLRQSTLLCLALDIRASAIEYAQPPLVAFRPRYVPPLLNHNEHTR